MNTSRRGFLSKIFTSAIAAPAVSKIIANGLSEPPKQCSEIPCTGFMDFSGSGDWDGRPYMTDWVRLRDKFPPLPIIK